MVRRRVLLGGGFVALVAIVVLTAGVLFTAPDPDPSEAAELFDAPVADGGTFCFRSGPVDTSDGLVVTVDGRDPDRRVRYFESTRVTRKIVEFPRNDTRIAVHDFSGDAPESRYQSQLDLIRNSVDENDTVVADDATRRIRVVDRNATVSGERAFPLLVPILGTLAWEPVNETAYRPVGGWITNGGPGNSNRTSYVSSATGVVRTDGNGSVGSVDVTYTIVHDVGYRVEPLFREGQRVRIAFEREFCPPTGAQLP